MTNVNRPSIHMAFPHALLNSSAGWDFEHTVSLSAVATCVKTPLTSNQILTIFVRASNAGISNLIDHWLIEKPALWRC